jgi:CMP-N,N'-diacetyllegionaminic acid synthase
MNKTDLKIVSLIPARSGSKGIRHKNIKLYKGIPLIGHSIKLSLKSKYISETYVSTDSKKYQIIAVDLGAKITPLRPASISDDLSPDIDTFKHFIKMFENNNEKIPDIIIQLRPTYPNRSVELLDNCIEKFLKEYNEYDSLRTVVPLKKTPYKMYYIENNNLIPYFKEHKDLIEPFNQARQNFPETYLHNGCIDIVKTSVIKELGLLSGNKILPFIMDEEELDDIDDINDFKNAEMKR